VAATDPDEGGVISPGGVGYDINCGVRLMRSNLFYRDVKPHLVELVEALFKHVPTGVGRSGRFSFRGKDLERLLGEGPQHLLGRELVTPGDLDFTEAHGRLDGADPDQVSDHAKQRGAEQCGTLGSGNHFLEVQVVDAIFDADAASVMGLEKDMICVMIHSGSRGLGYQVCDDALAMLRKAPEKYGIALPDRQLACAPVKSPEAQRYLGAMAAAANYARANRQVLAEGVRGAFASVLGPGLGSGPGLELVYDVSHNIAKLEVFPVGGRERVLCVHRKGATRAFGPGNPELPARYQEVGQPVMIPGSMGSASFVLAGRSESREISFSSTCHGAGRLMSRKKATEQMSGQELRRQLAAQGILVRAQQAKLLAEEAPYAYKDASEVVRVCQRVGMSRVVARLRPVGVVKG
jgi:tRNA-splicing ligase RtcB